MPPMPHKTCIPIPSFAPVPCLLELQTFPGPFSQGQMSRATLEARAPATDLKSIIKSLLVWDRALALRGEGEPGELPCVTFYELK
jgi:hypothetical protein